MSSSFEMGKFNLLCFFVVIIVLIPFYYHFMVNPICIIVERVEMLPSEDFPLVAIISKEIIQLTDNLGTILLSKAT